MHLAHHSLTQRDHWFALFLGLLAALIAYTAPVRDYEMSDTRGTLIVSQLIVQRGEFSFDNEPEIAASLAYRVFPFQGSLHYAYPIGTSLLATPFVAVSYLAGLDMRIIEDERALQNFLSAMSVALISACFFVLSRRFLPFWPALVVASSFVAATMVLSVLGAALWSLNGEIALSCFALLLLVPPSGQALSARRAVSAAILLGLAYICRPTIQALLPCALLYCWWLNRRAGIAFGLSLAGTAIAFVLFSLLVYRAPLPPYYFQTNVPSSFDPLWSAWALYGTLFSPGRGLFVYSPQLLLLAILLPLQWAKLRHMPLFWLAVGWFALHLAQITIFRNWWGGWSFGNRLISDALPALLILVSLAAQHLRQLPQWQQRTSAAMFASLSLVGLLVQTPGLYNPQTPEWNVLGRYDVAPYDIGIYSVEDFPTANFDWRFPPFLSSQAQFAERRAAYNDDPPMPNQVGGRLYRAPIVLQQSSLWRPNDLNYSPELAVMLDSGWYYHEPSADLRWMRYLSRLWIATEEARRVEIYFATEFINSAEGMREQGALQLRLNDQLIGELALQAKQPSMIEIVLEPGMNELELLSLTGEAIIPPDPRLLAVAFSDITLIVQP